MTAKEAFGYMWECPDLFEMGGKWFLLCCPGPSSRQKPERYQNLYQSGYFLCEDFTLENSITHVIQKHSASWIMALIPMPPDIYGRTGTAHSDRLGGDPGRKNVTETLPPSLRDGSMPDRPPERPLTESCSDSIRQSLTLSMAKVCPWMKM